MLFNQSKRLYNAIMRKSEAELSQWLLLGFVTGNFRPLRLTNEPLPSSQLFSFFCSLSIQQQIRFKDALLLTLSTWLPEHGSDSFLELIRLAAYIREPRIVSRLGLIIGSAYIERLYERRRSSEYTLGDLDEYAIIVQDILAVIQGFAPSDEVGMLFESLFLKAPNHINTEFGAQLFSGLCKCYPSKFPLYIQILLGIARRYPEYYSLPHLINELVRTLSLPTIVSLFNEIVEYRTKEELLSLLIEYDWSPTEMEYSFELGYYLVDRTSDPVGPPIPLSEDVRLLYNAKSRQIDSFGGSVLAVGQYLKEIAVGN
jgi:hypothetical protein